MYGFKILKEDIFIAENSEYNENNARKEIIDKWFFEKEDPFAIEEAHAYMKEHMSLKYKNKSKNNIIDIQSCLEIEEQKDPWKNSENFNRWTEDMLEQYIMMIADHIRRWENKIQN